jgi:hypothetical protein
VLRQWRKLTFEKKLGISVPLLIASITGVLVPVLLSSGGEPAASKHESQLEVVDLSAADGSRKLGAEDPLQALDITVRNLGDTVSVVKRVGLRVLDHGVIKVCQAGGGLEPSAQYKVILPPRPVKGALVSAKLSQQIPAGEADRFIIGMDLPNPARQSQDVIYQLQVLLFHDTSKEPLDAGTVLVSAPRRIFAQDFWSSVPVSARAAFAGEVGDCLQTNEKTAKRMLKLDGERPPSMDEELFTQAIGKS